VAEHRGRHNRGCGYRTGAASAFPQKRKSVLRLPEMQKQIRLKNLPFRQVFFVKISSIIFLYYFCLEIRIEALTPMQQT